MRAGRGFSLATDQPGVQIFTGNAWKNLNGKEGATYQAHSAIAFETQLFPNTPNTPSFEPRPVLAGEEYRHRMVFRFEALRANEYDSFLTSKL